MSIARDSNSLSVLAAPLVLRSGAVLPNRFVKAAMSENLATADNDPSPALIRLYERWGRSGAGVLLTGNVMVDRTALTESHNVVVDELTDRAALARWARAAQADGARLWMQINHPGRQVPRVLDPEPVAPSPVPVAKAGLFGVPRALSDAEIRDLIGKFARAARIARDAGFAGVEIHAAHGYLISQFLSPHTNQRQDRWGGSPRKRMRFLLEIVLAVREAVGTDFPVAVKLNSADFQRGGFTAEDALAVARALDTAGIDVLELSGGSYERPAMMHGASEVRDSTRAREAYFLEYAEAIRAAVDVPILLTGGFRTIDGMEAALDSGAVDLVGLARPMVVEPDLPARLLRGEQRAARTRDLRVGFRFGDDLLQQVWFQEQFRRMGRGQEPDADLNPWVALVGGAGRLFASGQGRRLRQRWKTLTSRWCGSPDVATRGASA